MNHWGGVRFWLEYIMTMPSAGSNEQLRHDIDIAIRCDHTRDHILGITKTVWNHPDVVSNRSALQKRIGLLTLISKTQDVRGLVTEDSSDSRDWGFWGSYKGAGNRVQGALLRAINVWWLKVKKDYGNSPVILATANQGMQPGGDETTASEFGDVAHHPGPYSDVPSWMSSSDYERHRQRQANGPTNQGSDSLLPTTDRKVVPLKTYTMTLGTLSNGSALCVIGTDNILVGPTKGPAAARLPKERPLSPHERSVHISQANTTDSASNGATETQWIGLILSPEITSTILLLDSCFHVTHDCAHAN